MKDYRNKTLVVTPYIVNGEIRFEKEGKVIDDDKPFFGDFFVDTKDLDLKKCRFTLARFNGKNSNDQSIKDKLRSQEEISGLIRVRMGESLLISNLRGDKHLQLVYLQHQDSRQEVAKLFFFRTNDVRRERLEGARKFAQRQDAQVRRQKTEKIDEWGGGNEWRPSAPPVTQPEKGYHSGAPMTVKPTWWKKAINWFTSNINKVSP